MTVGIRHDDLRRRNRAMVISAVRRARQPSRTEIARTTGLSHSTISAIASDLIEEAILTETKGEPTASKRGRPQVALGLNPEASSVVTILLALNALSATLIDYAGNIVAEEQRRLQTMTMGRDELIAEATGIVGRLLARGGSAGRKAMRISFAVQGVANSGGTAMLWSPITPHRDVRFGEALEKAFGLPVTLENDCNMMAVALRWRDPDRYRDNFISVLLSNGIGMGLFLNGELFTGTQSSGGEFGHMIHVPNGDLCRCGRRGCIEAYAGNYAIWRNARRLPDGDGFVADIEDHDMMALAEEARSRDGPERAAYRKAGEAIGFGLGSLFALIDPAPVAMVGIGARAFDLIEGPMRAAIARTAGGQHEEAISFATEPDQLPLIREGCAMRALTFIDEIFAAGNPPASATHGRAVA
ncbi:MAG: sugar kinase [Rhizobiales bacterium 65-79]|jgi:predicted NBD/HSP70 family sugar kinase|nr:ROK family transcriptional regulator [Hyphomicrobiales bacterium]OJU04722.1 MAG: sugar kinase [Rhizobiales bacterium 65-79]